ncbi:Asp23/Gls24 family envelope stress response protein [Lutispora sp.]|uniref:Asp23/Gls24 family envelope stress response protein n=1 Tax=Lutispora sp. TaxID=2828727 RepID=UPI002B1E9FF0|nr:Asp23/Gls24 family envelope stress response protein [Lutispora sp.]MEA4964134.1 Asp23/Gls24 family envelope stress response protein [Lutispora sp.]
MEVYALIGHSGTGKSYKAFMVAKDKNTQYIIDDGLLIGGTRVITGSSAKKEGTKLAAVRRALFKDEKHKEAVKAALKELGPERILVLGTSKRMVEQITEALEIPMPCEIIYINDISTDSEIDTAVKSRRFEGKHVIPVPTVEVKKDFSGYFIDSLKIFRRKEKAGDIAEKTIIRPTFSYLGKYEISKNALAQLVEMTALKAEGTIKVNKVRIDNKAEGVIIDLEVSLSLQKRLDLMMRDIQQIVREKLEYTTGLNVIAVNVWTVGLMLPDRKIYIGEI